MSPRHLIAAVVVTVGCASLPGVFAAPAIAGWTDPVCEVDGPAAPAHDCTPPADRAQPPAGVNSCAGAAVCEQAYQELRGTGFDTDDVRTEDDEALARLDLASAPARGGGVRFAGWASFHLYDGKHCARTVRDNGHCAWLYHKYRVITDEGPRPGVYVTAFPARSGNNYPPSAWVRNVGPVPDRFKGSGGKVRSSFRWGRMYGAFTGFEWDSRSSFSPGKWRLDPWVIRKPGQPDRSRSSFEIHGGRRAGGGSSLWTTRTNGCIRLSVKGVRGLKAKWEHRTDNRRNAMVFVQHHG